MSNRVEVATVSGGKDSTAMWLLGLERGVKLMPVFCDTGHEHPLTYEYMEYLEKKLGPVRHIKADFTAQIARKRLYVQEQWPRKLTIDVNGHWYTDEEEPEHSAPDWEPENREQQGLTWNEWAWLPMQKGMTDREAAQVVETALSVLYPTGIPFLDLCLWKGRFPGTKNRFCTIELKVRPAWEQVYCPMLEEGMLPISWQGVRAEESAARAKLPDWEDTPEGYRIYRPILRWTVEEVFAMHRKHGIEPNPLYKLGMGRVGCLPCVNCGKAELFEIARRFPEEVARVAEWERLVKMASKRQAATLFPTANGHGNGIYDEVEWSKTAYGGKQYDLIKAIEFDNVPVCSSQYGLCE
ncbi:phosphoadenosine phosphosulfate reductase domain-containing protein [Paenibacillus oleatilyticus]|uniref:phosphoadenosine phosphosulfate reductase domain-containing protein n=1 Tax=Paenibacillus oleatilyticus TaxID=2594886 RepID=UPI001C1F86EE|nr:phosphoadenosine phosphosulfate reductase family protein [Paenibacillus oleatilyticus]MBU7320300.1 phosphoadenosine phosphosulfate reductase family protein [Paenibacillus oleatilyticus]